MNNIFTIFPIFIFFTFACSSSFDAGPTNLPENIDEIQLFYTSGNALTASTTDTGKIILDIFKSPYTGTATFSHYTSASANPQQQCIITLSFTSDIRNQIITLLSSLKYCSLQKTENLPADYTGSNATITVVNGSDQIIISKTSLTACPSDVCHYICSDTTAITSIYSSLYDLVSGSGTSSCPSSWKNIFQ